METRHGTTTAVRQREELARFLRGRRERVQPEEVGLERQPRRRVSGLRRYEVAELAGVSDTWYTWLEQARDIRVSGTALDAVARALLLDEEARRYVRRLGGVPVLDATDESHVVRPEFMALLDDLLPSPACITTASFDFLAWNRAYPLIGGDPLMLSEGHRNALWSLFMSRTIRSRMRDWETEASGVVARLRYESSNFPSDPRFAEIARELTEMSSEFHDLWDRGDVRPFVERMVVFDHPLGPLHLRKVQVRPLDQPRLVITVHRPADDDTRERLTRLLASQNPSAGVSHTPSSD